MKKKNGIIIAVAILLIALCGFLIFGNKTNDSSNSQGGLQLGLTDEDKEDSKEKEESKKKEENSKDESKTDSSSKKDEADNESSSDSQTEVSEIPEGGQAVDNGDGSVTIIINDDEDTFGV